MAADTPLFYRNEKHAKSQVRRLVLTFQITAAQTVNLIPRSIDVLTTFGPLTQAQIDAYLSRPIDGYVATSSTGFTAAQFDATSMGTDAFGGIINMNQQCRYVGAMKAFFFTGAGNTTSTIRGALGTANLAASTLENAVGRSPSGDIAFKLIGPSGLDALTSGIIQVEIDWISD